MIEIIRLVVDLIISLVEQQRTQPDHTPEREALLGVYLTKLRKVIESDGWAEMQRKLDANAVSYARDVELSGIERTQPNDEPIDK